MPANTCCKATNNIDNLEDRKLVYHPAPSKCGSVSRKTINCVCTQIKTGEYIRQNTAVSYMPMENCRYLASALGKTTDTQNL
jgi:uncharacterized protein CbrC (UPF0167 family)